MLRAEDNKFLTEAGPGTGMGELLRRFWISVLLPKERREPDGEPKKIVVQRFGDIARFVGRPRIAAAK
ncbi:hypothetical protein AB7008_47820 [Bradyrhizobium sp. 521_C7_N1_3]|uniref:hypothetical protein n=1 Tax=Bradyrhizobium sp. 521_C7_N1_3 TaxID=3240368 RepID=UPI003F8AD38B